MRFLSCFVLVKGKRITYNKNSLKGKLIAGVDKAVWDNVPSTIGISLWSISANAIAPIVEVGGPGAEATVGDTLYANWRSGEVAVVRGYSASATVAAGGGASGSGSMFNGLVATYGNSSIGGIEGPSYIATGCGRAFSGYGGAGCASIATSYDPKASSLGPFRPAVDPVSGRYIVSLSVNYQTGFGVEASASLSYSGPSNGLNDALSTAGLVPNVPQFNNAWTLSPMHWSW